MLVGTGTRKPSSEVAICLRMTYLGSSTHSDDPMALTRWTKFEINLGKFEIFVSFLEGGSKSVRFPCLPREVQDIT